MPMNWGAFAGGTADARMARLQLENEQAKLMLQRSDLQTRAAEAKETAKVSAFKDAQGRLDTYVKNIRGDLLEFSKMADVNPDGFEDAISTAESALSRVVDTTNQDLRGRFGDFAPQVSVSDVKAALRAGLPKVGTPESRGAAEGAATAAKEKALGGPAQSFQTVAAAGGGQDVVGLDPRTGKELSRTQGAAQPNIQINSVEDEGGNKFILAYDKGTGKELYRLPSGAADTKAAFDPVSKRPLFATDAEIKAKGLTPIPSGMSVTVAPDGTVTLTQGTGITSATQSAAEQVVKNFPAVMTSLASLATQLKENPKLVGVVPWIQGWVNDTVAQFIPGLFDKDKAKFDATVKATFESALKIVSADTGNFSATERKAIADLFPSVGPAMSQPTAQVKVAVLQSLLLRRYAAAVGTLGGTPPTEAITWQDIAASAREGLISMDEAIAYFQLLYNPGTK